MERKTWKGVAAGIAATFAVGGVTVDKWWIAAPLFAGALITLLWGWWPELESYLAARGLRLPSIRSGSWTSDGITWETDGFTHSSGKEGTLVRVKTGANIQPMEFRVRLKTTEGIENYWVMLSMSQEIKIVGYWSPGEPNGARVEIKGDYLLFAVAEPAFRPDCDLVFNFIAKEPMQAVAVQRRSS